MDLQKLKTYESNEREKIGAVSSRILGKQEPCYSRLDLYPEFKDKLQGKVYTNALWGNSVLTQLPFFDVVIMPVPRSRTEDEYRKTTGLSVDQTIQLVDKGKIIPIIFETLINYRDLDYLDPILERKFPRCREVSFQSLVTKAGKYPDAKAKELRTVLERKDSELRALVKSGGKGSGYDLVVETLPSATRYEFSVDVSRFTKKSKTERINGLFQVYQLLRGLAGDDMVTSLLELPPDVWFLTTGICAENLVYNPSVALDGIVSIERDKFLGHRVLNLFLREKNPLTGQVFPIEIGRWLIETCQLVDVRDLGFEEVIEISEQTAKAREALWKLDKAVKHEQAQRVLHSRKAIQEVLEDTNRQLQSMIKASRATAKVISLSLAIIGGVIGSLAGLPGVLLGAGGSAVSSLPYARPIADRLVKIRKPAHITAVYDLKRSSRTG